MAEPAKKFETKRTRHLRSGELSERNARTITNIETYGCEVVQVKNTTAGPGWSYTVGVYDTCGKPEIITIGLKESTALYLLNEAAKQLRQGIDLTEGRHNEMIADVECEFRPVDPKWVKHLMGWATWYNGNADFPVLQAVYPDLGNRFPEDDGFSEEFRQPLLQHQVPMSRVENDFWASTDPDSSLFNWKFSDPPHAPVFLSATVHAKTEPITYVSHDIEDSGWQLLGDSMASGGGPVVCCFHHPIDDDPSLSELADLPLGWYAERAKPGEPWIRHQKKS